MSTAAPLRLVLDTNVWLDWMLFDDDAVTPLKQAQSAGRIAICIDEACARELEAVLQYDLGKRTPTAEQREAARVEYARIAKRTTANDTTASTAPLPRCSDRDDQKFLELARDCGADYLVTKDKALLVLARRKTRPAPCRIVTPSEMGAIFENAGGLVEGLPAVY